MFPALARFGLPSIMSGIVIFFCSFLTSLPVLGVMQDVAEQFNAGNYIDAQNLLTGSAQSSRPAENALWQSRLVSDPDQALALLWDALDLPGLPDLVQVRIVLEIAELESAIGRPEKVLQVLSQVFQDQNPELPGAAYLQAGFAYRSLGQLQKAREMLASIRPDDEAFVQARGTLGEIGLQQDDSSLALRYFQSSLVDNDPLTSPAIAAGLWQSLRRTDGHQEAEMLVDQLKNSYPGSLALLEINRILRSEREELEARVAGVAVPADSVVARTDDRVGRFCLQLGAFSDRGLALEFQMNFEDQVPDLHIEEVRDDRGQFLYKLRSGSFVNPAMATTEARRLERLLDIDVIVSDLAN